MSKQRFITAIVTAASYAESETQMPWTRGTHRAEFISRRRAPLVKRDVA